MIKNHLPWKELFCIFILLVLTSSFIHATEKVKKQQSDPSPLEMVTKYLGERGGATTYQNKKTEKELLGKQYSGIVEVWDVVEVSGDLIIKAMQEGHWRGCELRFRIQKSNIKEKSGKLRKYDSILIVATLEDFQIESSGYINVSDMYIAMFKDVQKLEVQPTKK